MKVLQFFVFVKLRKVSLKSTKEHNLVNPFSQYFKPIFGFLLITISLFSLTDLKADNTFPFSYAKQEFYQGSELVVTKSKENNFISFLIKPNWAEEAEVLYSWNGIVRNAARGSTIGEAFILASNPLEKTILMVWKENERIYLANIDSAFSMLSVTEIYGDIIQYAPVEARWCGKTMNNEYLLMVNQNLYIVTVDKDNTVKPSFIAGNVQTAVPLDYSDSRNKKLNFAYVINKEGSGIVYFVSADRTEKFGARIPLADDIRLQAFGQQAAAITSSKSYPNSLVQIIECDRGVISEFWLETSADRIIIKSDKKHKTIYYLKNNLSYYTLIINDYSNIKRPTNITYTNLPKELIEPIGFWLEKDMVVTMFRNGVTTCENDGELMSADFLPFGEYLKQDAKINIADKYIIFSSQTASIVLQQQNHPFWLVNRFFNNFGRILIPTLLILALIILMSYYRSQKRLLGAVLNLPTSGVVFVIDQIGRLTSANGSGKTLLGITDSVPLRKLFQYYCELEHTKPILELVEKALSTRDTIVQKLNIVKGLDVSEWYCTVIPLRNGAGNYKGLVVTGIDITEQLERKRLSNWAQLAHDMQTNLSTIRLNAEQFDLDLNSTNNDRRKKIIHQVGLLIQRVRDIVTVGRSDSVNKEMVDSYDICHEVRSEFDEAMFPHVEFDVDAEHFNVNCDKPKIIRAVRNAVENGIRAFQGKPGKIRISNRADSRFGYIAVKDNGAGMDDKTKAKMLTPYFTTAKKSGGAGIGTMIMQHVMELHGGDIKINSEKGKGTEVVFCIPYYTHNPDKIKKIKSQI